MLPDTGTSGVDALDAKAAAAQGRRRRRPPPPKRKAGEQGLPGEPADTSTPDVKAVQGPPGEPATAEISTPDLKTERPEADASERPSAPKATRPPRRSAPAGPVDPAVVASSVKFAHDHALAYGATVRKQSERLDLWLASITTARDAGATPGLLRAGLEDAANRAGVPVDQIPAAVWRAAGLTP